MEYKPQNVTCQSCNSSFTVESDDFSFYEKIKVPPPTWCHKCRLQRKLTWRNERTLYKRNCNLCQKAIISVFSEEKPFPIYCYTCFHSNDWNPLSYGEDVDLSKIFLKQFHDLQKKVPRQYALAFNNINSEYVNGAGFNKNCYLIFVSDHNEDCLYSYNIYNSKNSLDLSTCFNCEYSYELLNCSNCSNSSFLIDCKDSYDIHFSKDCVGCHDLIGCVGLRNKSYYIFNIPYSKDEFKKRVDDMNLGTYNSMIAIKKQSSDLFKKYPVKYYHGNNNVDVSGDNINNSKNSKYIFSAKGLEDCKYIINGNQAKDCYECYVAVDKSELCFDSLGCFGTLNTKASHLPWSSYDLDYCDGCQNSSNCFGCVSLKNEEYCILNKKYSKEDYFILKDKIIQNMINFPYIDKKGRKYNYGDFFPTEISPYKYNETVAFSYFPLNKDQVIENGYDWKDDQVRDYKIKIKPEDLPNNIKNVEDSIVDQIIGCEHNGLCKDQCSTAFKITQFELQLYKNLNIPLPRLCHNCRYAERSKLENPKELWHRSCMKEGRSDSESPQTRMSCNNEFETSYSPERPEIIYCEKCYQNEVY